jgi:hypothetical protein
MGWMLMIAAFAMAMMRQAGLINCANSLARHVIFILLSPFADGKVFGWHCHFKLCIVFLPFYIALLKMYGT